MTVEALRLLSPELTLAGLALLVIGLDLVVGRKGFLLGISLVGLLVPIALSVLLWIDVDKESGKQLVGIFNTITVDHFALYFKFLVLLVVGLVLLASADYVGKMERRQGEYFGLIMFSAVGMMLLAATRDLISIYISLELTALPLTALVAFLMTDRSSEAGMKFFIISAISSALMLYGMVLIFGFTGSVYLTDIADSLSALPGGGFGGEFVLLLGIVLMVVGFGFKISAVPFHMWVPDVYEGAPTPITAYLSVASKAAGFAVLLRIFYISFGTEALQLDWAILFAVLAAASMTVGNLMAISQTNIKRMLAYSTIAHAGYLLVGLAAVAAKSTGGETIGPSSILFYLGAYAVTNLAAFFAIMAISNKVTSDQIADFAGASQRAPFLSFALGISLVALIGVPPTGIFIAKLYIFSAAVDSGLLWLAIVGVLNSVISAYYYLRVVRVIYLDPPASEERVPSSYSFRLALLLSTLAILALGLVPGPLLKLAELSVATLPNVVGGLTGTPTP